MLHQLSFKIKSQLQLFSKSGETQLVEKNEIMKLFRIEQSIHWNLDIIKREFFVDRINSGVNAKKKYMFPLRNLNVIESFGMGSVTNYIGLD
jgi:hypothetical protein